MKCDFRAAVFVLAVLSACQQASIVSDDDGPGTHLPGGDRIGPSYKLADDPRVTEGLVKLVAASRARCIGIADTSSKAYESCIIDHLAAALPFGTEMKPYCESEADFAEHFYCVMVGSAAADLLDKSKAADPHEFLRAHGAEQRESGATAVQMLATFISEKCPLDWTHTGCAANEMASLLDRTASDIKECSIFNNDWKDATCVVIGRMAAMFSESAAKMP